MSDYTLAVNWSGKDALSDSDAAKVISGSDFNTEFTTIRTAVNSKADTNGDSGEDFAMNNGTAATQSASDNSTKIATTAYVTTAVAALDKAAINNLVYPVGSIYTSVGSSATTPTEVNTLLGVGTWVAFGAGKVPVGIDATDTDFDVIKETGGTKTHTLTTSELPSHTHTFSYTQTPSSALANTQVHPISADGGSNPDYNVIGTKTTDATGSGSAHTNIQPYIVVYMWERTA